jgi:prepilin-type N-terminal cleavage/methylation domain-containing protein
MSICLNKKAFSLLEAVIAIAIFVMFAMGVYGGIQLIFKII